MNLPKLMKSLFILILVTFSVQITTAQYTEIINSKRPGFSESPYGIGTDVFQFETGFFYRSSNNESNFARPTITGGELFFRYGKFKEKLEFNLNISYQKDEVILDPLTRYYVKGISDLTIGAKYLIYQQEFADKSKEIRSWKRRIAFDKKRLIPSIGVYAGVHTNYFVKESFLNKDSYINGVFYEDGFSYKAAILLQNDFTDRLVVLSNLIADRIASENEFYSYIVTMTYAINEQWSFFFENQGKYRKLYAPEYQFGTGLAYLFSRNLQFDASLRTNFFDTYSYLYIATGISWRLDHHQDTFVYKNAPPKKIKKKKKRKGFFSRLFGKKRRKL